MKGLSQRERALLIEIRQTGDFGGHGSDDEDWAAFDTLEDRGLVGWAYGPISRFLDEKFGPDDPDDGEPVDPVVTAFGLVALQCAQLAGVTP